MCCIASQKNILQVTHKEGQVHGQMQPLKDSYMTWPRQLITKTDPSESFHNCKNQAGYLLSLLDNALPPWWTNWSCPAMDTWDDINKSKHNVKKTPASSSSCAETMHCHLKFTFGNWSLRMAETPSLSTCFKLLDFLEDFIDHGRLCRTTQSICPWRNKMVLQLRLFCANSCVLDRM